ncbi:MAG: selenide, water dikinase SelD [Flavobacteriales bacterium]|nr:selenide, water dikinase SelD [Flavobacteriales bacterium]MCB9193797.1 selenide, water dikinase SelD [Flavobacteriales bacterium]
MPDNEIRLTRYSSGAGCGCKIAPGVLEKILQGGSAPLDDPKLLVGYGSRDDAAVYDLGDGSAVISTVDFFSPIVDDPRDFGRIAAANALSDVYAMGGRPMVAVAVLGWPVEKLPAEMAAQVVDGGRQVCTEAGIVLAGGHSIDAPEPFFGLAVTGHVREKELKRNDSARPGDSVVLTRPIGTGVLSTALKRGLLDAHACVGLTQHLATLNWIGGHLGGLPSVTAMTDVTGFGLFGHLLEMCGQRLSVSIDWSRVPVLPGTIDLVRAGCYADGALRNWKSYHERITGAGALERMMLGSDPQTNGGLLIAVDPEIGRSVPDLLTAHGIPHEVIGRFSERAGNVVLEVK